VTMEQLSYEETQRLNGLAYDEMLRRNGHTPRASKHNNWEGSSLISLSDAVNGDYTRAEKAAMTASALGVEHSPGRRAAAPARKSWRRHAVPPSQQLTIEKPVMHTSTKAGSRSKSVRDRARRNLAHVTSCAYCGKHGSGDKGPDGALWHLDHVTPLIKGGQDSIGNLVKACARCNMMKGSKLWHPIAGTTTADGSVWKAEQNQTTPEAPQQVQVQSPLAKGFSAVQAELDQIIEQARLDSTMASAKLVADLSNSLSAAEMQISALQALVKVLTSEREELATKCDFVSDERDTLAARLVKLEAPQKRQRWWHR